MTERYRTMAERRGTASAGGGIHAYTIRCRCTARRRAVWAHGTRDPTVELAPGVQLPTIGFGTWQITGTPAYESDLAALDVGYRHIDTATMYGNEEEIGRALRDSGVDRSEIFITTKLPPSQAGLERQTIEAASRRSASTSSTCGSSTGRRRGRSRCRSGRRSRRPATPG